MNKHTLYLDGNTLTINDLIPIIQGVPFEVKINKNVIQKVQESREVVDSIVSRHFPVYGVSTGFGKFKDIFIGQGEMVQLQRNLIISHSCGVGDSFQPYQVQLMMILRLNCLLKGNSGVRVELVEKLQEAINLGVIPRVPMKGSVGASGDLCPLAHLALGLMGEGELLQKNDLFVPLEYKEKESLAMINGTQMMSMCNAEACIRGEYCLNACDLALAMSLFACEGNLKFSKSLNKWSEKTCLVVQQLLNDGELNNKNRKGVPRCFQSGVSVHGMARQTLEWSRTLIQREMNSTSDNPIIDKDEMDAKSGGNFHGEYMAQCGDMMGITFQRLAILSERRVERLVNSELNECGLPMFLSSKGGVLNGYMIPQYTCAALVSENKVLCHPSCVDTVPTSANIEDHVSMGAYSSRKALQIVSNLEYIVAIELMCGAQALEFIIKKDQPIPVGLKKIRDFIRDLVPDCFSQDIYMSKYIEQIAHAVRLGIFQQFSSK